MRAFLSPSDAFQSPTVGEQWDGSLFHEGGPGHIFTVLDNLVDFSEGLDTDCVKAQFLSYQQIHVSLGKVCPQAVLPLAQIGSGSEVLRKFTPWWWPHSSLKP